MKKRLVGVDVFLCWDEAQRDANVLAKLLHAAATAQLSLTLITNRGVKVFPEGMPETFCTDHWRCRFKAAADDIPYDAVIELLQNITRAGLDIIKTENLCTLTDNRDSRWGRVNKQRHC